MSELTIQQIVKIVMAVFVLVLVLAGVYMIFKDKINSYFDGLAPKPEKDLDTPYYQLLMQSKNLVATTPKTGTYRFITIVNANSKTLLGKTNYYFDKKEKIYLNKNWLLDKQVGEIGTSGKISILPAFASDPKLKVIEGGEKIDAEIYKL